MKRSLAFVLVLAAVSGQSQVYMIKDSFDDNRMNWWEGKSGVGSQHITNGALVMEFPEDGWTVGISPYVVFERDFTTQVSLRQISGLDTRGFGIVWGYDKNAKDFNSFQIASNGHYFIANTAAEMGKEGPGVRTWVKTKFVKPLGEVNVLKIEQKSGSLTFYINDQSVLTTPKFRWRGSEIGFTAAALMKVEADDLSFLQEGLKINVPPDLPKGFTRENLGPNVNTSADDLMPRISADGRVLYFGRRYYEGNIGGSDDGEDFYTSTFTGSEWSIAENLGEPVNSTHVDNISSISADNNSLVFISNNTFWIRRRNGSGWSRPVNMGIGYTNESMYFEACLVPDGKAMFFTLKNGGNLFYRPEVDERDIYISWQGEEGKWSSPLNIGPDVNTDGDEASPFMAADGRTLYFASSGRPGYGRTDLFMTKRQGEGWTKWSEPVNLGPEINSTGFDAYYVVPASGDYAYMVSDNDGRGKNDIVRIKLPKELKPDPVVLVSGTTIDKKTKKPMSASIRINNFSSNQEVGEATSHPVTGEFKIVLPYGTNYGFQAVAHGYLPVSENLDLTVAGNYEERKTDLYLAPIEVGGMVPLNNVFFEQSLPILKPESFVELNRLVEMMNENPGMEIELDGHTDNQGTKQRLIVLSQDRVNTVRKYMIDKGIPGRRISGKGYGPSRPIEKNDTPEHRVKNRRVEFKVVKM